MKKNAHFLFFLLCLFSTSQLSAQLIFALDTTFATKGRDTLDYATHEDYAQVANTQSDKKIVGAGIVYKPMPNASWCGISLCRYNEDGTRDSTFGNKGLVISHYEDYIFKFICDIVFQSDNKIVVSGGMNNASTGEQKAIIIRYLPNGTLDPSFGTNGTVYLDLDNTNAGDTISHLQILPNGKILGVGYAGYDAGSGFGAVRLNPDGSLDNTFGNNGIVFRGFGKSRNYPTGITLQSGGKILIGGTLGNYWQDDIILLRFLADGSIDNTFGTNGVVLTDIQNKNTTALFMEVMGDSSITIMGSVTNYLMTAGSERADTICMLRYLSNGILDSNFGNNGVVMHYLNDYCLYIRELGNSSFLQEDGSIILGGNMSNYGYLLGQDFPFLMRILPSGAIDMSIGTNGFSASNPYPYYKMVERASCTIPYPDNRAVQFGVMARRDTFNNPITDAYIARYNLTESDITSNENEFGAFLQTKVSPNPFSNAFSPVLSFSLNDNAPISIELYDMQGKQLSQIVNNESYTKGNHEIPLNIASNLASGTYMLVIRSNRQMSSMPILKY